MHGTHAHAPHERTSLMTPPQTVETSVAVAAAAAARPPAFYRRPLAAMATTSERPARVGVGTGERGLRGGRAEGSLSSSSRSGRAPSDAVKSLLSFRMMVEELEVEVAREKSRATAP